MSQFKVYLLGGFLASAFCFLLYLLFIRPYAYRWKTCPEGKTYGTCIPCGYQVHGMDISHYQGRIDWNQVQRNNQEQDTPLDFVFAKATEGSDLRDSTYRYNARAAREAGLKCGAYHFYTTTSAAEQQARFFIDNVELRSGDLPPVLDVEKVGKLDKQQLQSGVLRWLKMVEEHFGVKPILYTSYKFRERYLDAPELDAYPYWIAHYYVDSVRYQGHWEFWQYSDVGQVPGIPEHVDLNVFHGSEADFASLLIP